MRISPNMSLRVWNELSDPYDHEQLAGNWGKVDAHDHSPGRGVRLGTTSLEEHAITYPLLSKRPFHELYNVLPGSPEDGEVIYYTPEEGVVWSFRYHSGSASTHKWEFIGGSNLVGMTKGPFKVTTTGSLTTWAALGSNEAAETSPSLTFPLNGDYEVGFGFDLVEATSEPTTEVQINLSLGIGSLEAELIGSKSLNEPRKEKAKKSVYLVGTYTGATAAQKAKIYTSGNNTTAELWKLGRVNISVCPRRVG